jgi:HSP20 family protein
VEEGNLYLRERSFGSFAREILLPDGVDTEALDAKYEGGVLTVRIPMPIEVQGGARKIPISFETTEEEVLEAGSEH